MAENREFNSLMIQQYLEGKLDPKQMHALEKQALNDPFLADAIEGYAHTTKPVDHQLSILQRQLEERIALYQDNKNKYNFTWQRLSIAAAAGLMFITVGILFWMNSQKDLQTAATEKKVDVELTPKPEDKAERPVQQEILADNTTKETAAVPLRQTAPIKPEVSVPEVAAMSIAANAAPMAKSMTAANPVTGGVVSEAGGQPLSGVSVKVKGTGIATVTDGKGKFTLPDSVKGTLDVSYLGFENRQVNISPGDKLAVVLHPDNNSLNEIVITGRDASTAQPSTGWENFKEYLAKNTRYPETKVSGEVIVGFRISSKGRPENIRIVRSLNAPCDAEAIRLIKAGPEWKVAASGQTSEVRVNINFRP